MTSVTLETLSLDGNGKDLYQSVRIGQEQKLARLRNSKNFNFTETSRSGKIEVYRRVGVSSILTDSPNSSDLSLAIDDGTLGLRVSVSTGAEGKADNSEPEEKGKRSKREASAAQEYMDRHGLEVRLSEAMQAVLREKPDDPGRFMAEFFANEPRPPESTGRPKPSV